MTKILLESSKQINNKVDIIGKTINNPSYSHSILYEKFYLFNVSVSRNSGNYDVIPVLVSNRDFDTSKYLVGKTIQIKGEYRSFNQHIDGKNHLILTVFAQNINILEVDETITNLSTNKIYLDGYICREPTYRKTPLGREITDLMLAVNRANGKTDYIPCICWGRNSRYASHFNVGEHIQITGRIQSRKYKKKIDDNNFENKIAYEVSVTVIKKLNV